jgi:hypothetical protein
MGGGGRRLERGLRLPTRHLRPRPVHRRVQRHRPRPDAVAVPDLRPAGTDPLLHRRAWGGSAGGASAGDRGAVFGLVADHVMGGEQLLQHDSRRCHALRPDGPARHTYIYGPPSYSPGSFLSGRAEEPSAGAGLMYVDTVDIVVPVFNEERDLCQPCLVAAEGHGVSVEEMGEHSSPQRCPTASRRSSSALRRRRPAARLKLRRRSRAGGRPTRCPE